ncbi:MAG: carboxypeptidase-like regulatory domain-containing protein, partial [Bacteroidetes bacterium]|nr:carboxypeptidase-like regulatory domain-containing protein [Bacteroidota bacterium]
MKHFALSVIACISFISSFAGKISGTVADEKGQVLAYASILVKGTAKGTSANNEGKYFLYLEPGTYTIVAQYVGYERKEKQITIGNENLLLDFQLRPQQLSLAEVVVKPGGEDPAYDIIRHAIKKRAYYQQQLDKFQCEVYIKGQLRLRNFPKSFMGQKIDFEDGDTSKKKIVYLYETLARYTVAKPDKSKVEVYSTKVSGQSGAFGFLSNPQIISFYENNMDIARNLNPRGFISPISDNALHYYKYKFEGVFHEDGKEVNKIKVTPKRKFEPLFSGYINIVDGDWRIHSVDLALTKESQMEFLDTFRIEQLYVPFEKDVWVIKTQVIYPSIKLLGFDAYGSFVNVYSKFDLSPSLPKKFFSSTVLKFDEGSNKRPADYWDTIRPVPLQLDEIADYRKKDSLEKLRQSPHYLDSVDRIRNKPTATGILLTGQAINKEKTREQFNYPALISTFSYNTVEGLAINWRGTYTKRIDSSAFSRRSISVTPDLRYGFSNTHFNAYAVVRYNYGKKYFSSFNIAGGKRVYQFNNANPINPLYNTFSTLFWESNYMKLYEAWFGKIYFNKTIGDGLRVGIGLQYQDRMPLENSTDYSFVSWKTRSFTKNYPVELLSQNIPRHQAFIANAEIIWQPGAKYIEFPDRKMMIRSDYPRFQLSWQQGVPDIFGSNIDYSKWKFSINQTLNLKLAGSFDYHISAGGFLYANKLFVPDYYHFNGNQVVIASD